MVWDGWLPPPLLVEVEVRARAILRVNLLFDQTLCRALPTHTSRHSGSRNWYLLPEKKAGEVSGALNPQSFFSLLFFYFFASWAKLDWELRAFNSPRLSTILMAVRRRDSVSVPSPTNEPNQIPRAHFSDLRTVLDKISRAINGCLTAGRVSKGHHLHSFCCCCCCLHQLRSK